MRDDEAAFSRMMQVTERREDAEMHQASDGDGSSIMDVKRKRVSLRPLHLYLILFLLGFLKYYKVLEDIK